MSIHLRVAHAIPSLLPEHAGTTIAVRELVAAQINKGCEAVIHTVGEASASAQKLAVMRHRNDLAVFPIMNRLLVSRHFKDAIVRGNYDIVHTHGLWTMPNMYGTHAVKKSASSFIISPHGMLSSQALAFSPIRKRFSLLLGQRKALLCAHLFHATSAQEASDIRAYGLTQPIAVIPHGIEALDLPTQPSARRTVLSLGRLHPIKALDSLIAAWADIEPIFKDWRLRIVGPDNCNHATELRYLIESLGLSRVSIEGPLSGVEKLAAFASAGLFVVPSRSENFALTVAEALAAGTPVIASKGTPWDRLPEVGCGWWIDHGARPLAEALREAMSLQDQERNRMGLLGRAWMERDFSWSSVAERFAAVYSWIRGSGDKPDCVL